MAIGDTVYDTETAATICERLAAGETLRQICRSEGMPAESTVRLWALDDREGFAAQYARAREIGYQSMADELLEIMDDGQNDWMCRAQAGFAEDDPRRFSWQLNGEHINRSRLRVEGRKWLLSKALPKIYGDKVALTDGDGGPLIVQVVKHSANDSDSQ